MRHQMKIESERRLVCKFVKKSHSAKIIKSKNGVPISPPENNYSKSKAQR